MRRFYVLIISLAMVMVVSAQEGGGEQQKFSPEKFDAELQEFIVCEAKLTQQEAAKFFPVYKEMQAKQRVLFEKQKALGNQKSDGEAACQKAIREHDDNDLEMKRIQKTYHERFLELLPASKVYSILQAEDRFHRRMLKRWSHDKQQQPHQHKPQQQKKR